MRSDDRRRGAQPPSVRGRRGHPVIPEVPGLTEWLEAQFEEFPRPSFREIEERLQKTPFWEKIRAKGYKTGKSSIHTHWVKWSAERAHHKAVAEYAEQLVAETDPADAFAIETAITRHANVAILDELVSELAGGKVTDTAKQLIDLHRKLQSSSARREAERRASGSSLRRAYEEARSEIAAILKEDPEARRRVLAAIDNAQNSAERKAA